MNYLAHFHLGAASDDALVGALLGDHVKGPLRGGLPAGWEQGIQLHRRIDAISDRLPLRRTLAAALPPAYRRYAGIMLDVCCDHWLSLDWPDWHPQPLPAFAARVYRVLEQREPELPATARDFSRRLRTHDMLCAYGDWAAVPATLARIGTRLRHASPLADCDAILTPVAAALAPQFPAFYRTLQQELAGVAISAAPRN